MTAGGGTMAPGDEDPCAVGKLLPAGNPERQIGAFVDHHNNQRYHEGLNNLTPADVYHG